MASRLIDGVPPRYPARDELTAAEAAAKLKDSITDLLVQAELIITAREEVERRVGEEINNWARKERARLGLGKLSFPAKPPGLDENIKNRVRAEVELETGIENLDAAPRLQVRAPAGIGKTTCVIDELSRREFWRLHHVHFYVPTIELGKGGYKAGRCTWSC